MIGYFANEKVKYRRSKTHIVENRKPICGSKVSKANEFYWCSVASRIDYVECRKCQKLYWIARKIG